MVMSFIKKSTIVLGALLLAPSAAWAVAGDVAISKTLNTSALYADGGQTYHACVVTNVTTANVFVKVDLLDSQGNTIVSTGTSPYTVNAGTTLETSLQTSETYTGFARCRILVYNGNDDSVRANEAVFVKTGAYFTTIAFSEAR